MSMTFTSLRDGASATDQSYMDGAAARSSQPATDSSSMGPPTQWRRRRRAIAAELSDGSDDNNSVVSGHWQPDAADVEMVSGLSLIEALPMGRMRVDSGRVVRRAKRMKLDLEASASLGETLGEAASVEGGMFAELSLVAAEKSPDEHSGGALLCFLSQETFVGFVELQHEGVRHILKLSGSESLTECNRELCGAQDCCGDKAYVVTVQSVDGSGHGKRKRRFLARSSGVGDYVAFEGRGISFDTDLVPGDEQRDEVLGRHFSMLPRAVRRESVLCLGRMTLQWRGLAVEPFEQVEERAELAAEAAVATRAREEAEAYSADKSSGESGDEDGVDRSMGTILPMLARVAMPTPSGNSFSLDELIARGGTPVTLPQEDDWL
ncbi:hypothetical protein AB1Y20_023151 [Prymnesium parvum]|uniref:Altered inheritance of mitochondria protein 24, mitochondrial n=1 Tax=Prymnesium parvum TaxID=97485 RepID=A0AB34JFJ1_PRYPA